MIKVHKERHAQRPNGGEETKRELHEDHRYLTQNCGSHLQRTDVGRHLLVRILLAHERVIAVAPKNSHRSAPLASPPPTTFISLARIWSLNFEANATKLVPSPKKSLTTVVVFFLILLICWSYMILHPSNPNITAQRCDRSSPFRNIADDDLVWTCSRPSSSSYTIT